MLVIEHSVPLCDAHTTVALLYLLELVGNPGR